MRRLVLLVSALAFVLAMAPAGAATASAVDCGGLGGDERLTLDGYEAVFDAPTVTAPELAATADVTGRAITPWREGLWHFTADFAPVSAARVTFTLEWEDPSDYDLVVYDDEGWSLGASQDENLQEGTATEQVTLSLAHCDRFSVSVRSWAGLPAQELTLTIVPEPAGAELRCDEGDTAPGCAGKEAGEVPDPVEDGRTFLYLAGDRPGQGSMAWGEPNNLDLPLRSGFSHERPTSGTPNSYNRPAVGFNQYRNQLQAHFTEFDMDRDVVGTAEALVWVSSRTMADHGGTLFVQLYLDGAKAGEVEVPGSAIDSNPTPIVATFEDVDVRDVWDVTLMLAAEPVASSQGTTSELGDAHYQVHYDSVQFPSRLVLP
jgi:hypothetical protein